MSKRRKLSRGRSVARGGTIIILVGFMALAIAPFLLMVLVSLRETHTLSLYGLRWDELSLTNYLALFTYADFGQKLLNSTIVVVLACTLVVVICTLAGYGFSKARFPGSNIVFWIFLSTMMIPGTVTLIPFYLVMRSLGMLNSYLGLALPAVGVFGVFLMRQFIESIPDELLDAARVDGASSLRILTRIVVPMVSPAISALTIFTFLAVWNDFLWPLLAITDPDMQTATLAISQLKGRSQTDYGLMMAGTTVTFLPPFLVFFVLKERFVEGISLGALK
jgi:multiple sugar transport system permease protein